MPPQCGGMGAFYERHGLTVLEKITLPKLDLPMWLMLRKPQ